MKTMKTRWVKILICFNVWKVFISYLSSSTGKKMATFWYKKLYIRGGGGGGDPRIFACILASIMLINVIADK